MFENNKICRLLGIKLPVVQGGMVWCAGWRLASAVSEHGGLGVLGCGSMTADVLREHIAKTRAATSRPFGVNVPLGFSAASECMEVAFEMKVPVILTSAGSPRIWTQAAHEHGCKVGHVVPNAEYALKAEAAGVDFIVCEGVEAGGHNGLDELSTLVLTQLVRKASDLPLLSAGGYHDGYGLAAAIALGADGVQIGSRFACTVESSAHDNFKNEMLQVGTKGTALTCRGWGPTRQIRSEYSDELLAMAHRGESIEAQRAFVGSGRTRRGIFEGQLAEGELDCGQIAGIFDRIETVQGVMDHIRTTYRLATERLAKTLTV